MEPTPLSIAIIFSKPLSSGLLDSCREPGGKTKLSSPEIAKNS